MKDYLYPVLAWGPNNQIAGLKEALVLGRLLRRTVIVHDILHHYDDKKEATPGTPTSMPFEQVFDLDHVSRHQSVVTLEEHREAGWDGVLDAVAHFGNKFLPQIKTARALNVSDDGAAYIDFDSFQCTRGQLEAMSSKLAKYRVVAFIVYENIVRDAGHGVKLRVTGDACHDEYLRVSAQLTKSPQLISMAQEFIKERLGGEKYVAIHVRPYPDKCLYVWQRPEYNVNLAARECKNKNLYSVFAGQTKKAMDRWGLRQLFVMTYPVVRPKVKALLAAEGIRAVFYDEVDLEKAVGYKSISLLGMLEEEIAFEAEVFIGTSYSSMTGIIQQERFARGIPTTKTYVFAHTGG